MKTTLLSMVGVCLLIVNGFAQSETQAPSPTMKFFGVIDVTSNLAASNAGPSSDMFNVLGLSLDGGDYGMVLDYSPNATLNASGPVSANVQGGGYTTSPFYTVPDEYYAWVSYLGGKVKILAGGIEENAFDAHATFGGPVVQDRIATSNNEGLETQVRPIDNLLLGVYLPLSLGDNGGITKASLAGQYTFPGVAKVNVGWIGANRISSDTGSPTGAFFTNAQLLAISTVKAYLGYEYSDSEDLGGGANWQTKNDKYIEFGLKYTGIDKLSVGVDGEYDFFTSTKTSDTAGYCILLNAEYKVVEPISAGVNLWLNQDAGFGGFFAAGPSNLLGNTGFSTGEQINPYLLFPLGDHPPFGQLTVGFDYNILSTGNTWSIPVDVTVVF